MPGRKGMTRVIEAFLKGESKGSTPNKSISISGKYLYSYNTRIATLGDKIVYLNDKKYSSTTTAQQGIIRYLASRLGFQIVIVDESFLASH